MRSQITENTSPMKIFEEVTGLDKLIKLIVTRSNLYTQQYGSILEVDAKQMKTFFGINYTMVIKKTPSIAEYQKHLLGILGFKTPWFEVNENTHYGKAERVCTLRTLIEHLKSKVSEVLSNYNKKSIDEQMVKIKD